MEEKNLLFAFGKTIGFIVAVSVFFFVLLNWIFNPGFWHKNLFLLAELLAIAGIINFLIPRILKMFGEKKFSEGIQEGAMLFVHKLNDTILFVGLLATYIIAVGFVFIISKILRKNFLQLKKSENKSLWLEKKPATEKDYFKNQF